MVFFRALSAWVKPGFFVAVAFISGCQGEALLVTSNVQSADVPAVARLSVAQGVEARVVQGQEVNISLRCGPRSIDVQSPDKTLKLITLYTADGEIDIPRKRYRNQRSYVIAASDYSADIEGVFVRAGKNSTDEIFDLDFEALCDADDDDVDLGIDNCPDAFNPEQIDSDGNGVGDACEECTTFSLVADIVSGAVGSAPRELTKMNGQLYFTADTANGGRQLFGYDPLSGSTTMLSSFASGSVESLAAIDSKLYFAAFDAAVGTELFSYSPASGIALEVDISEGASSSSPSGMTLLDGDLYFAATNVEPDIFRELYKYDPATGEVSLVFNANDEGSGSPSQLQVVNGKLYFVANNDFEDSLYELDPSSGQTDWLTGPNVDLQIFSSDPSGSREFAVINDTLYFSAYTPTTMRIELHGFNLVSREISIYPVIVAYPGTDDPDPDWRKSLRWLTAVDNKLYFQGLKEGDVGQELFVFDPAVEETRLAADFATGDDSSSPSHLTVVGNIIYLQLVDGVASGELYLGSFDTASGASQEFFGVLSSPSGLTLFNDEIYLSAGTAITGEELFLFDPDCP